jgi:hypothetical protein
VIEIKRGRLVNRFAVLRELARFDNHDNSLRAALPHVRHVPQRDLPQPLRLSFGFGLEKLPALPEGPQV